MLCLKSFLHFLYKLRAWLLLPKILLLFSESSMMIKTQLQPICHGSYEWDVLSLLWRNNQPFHSRLQVREDFLYFNEEMIHSLKIHTYFQPRAPRNVKQLGKQILLMKALSLLQHQLWTWFAFSVVWKISFWYFQFLFCSQFTAHFQIFPLYSSPREKQTKMLNEFEKLKDLKVRHANLRESDFLPCQNTLWASLFKVKDNEFPKKGIDSHSKPRPHL